MPACSAELASQYILHCPSPGQDKHLLSLSEGQRRADGFEGHLNEELSCRLIKLVLLGDRIHHDQMDDLMLW